MGFARPKARRDHLDFKPFKIGKYLLLERIAMGGMAEVYRAKASGAGGFEKQLAIKRILPNYSQNEEFRRMFEYEARLSSMLTHSNIVQIYDFVKSSDTYLLAMEYVDGKNLRQFINKIKKIGFVLPVEYGVYVVSEVCKGLEYAHKKRDDLTNRPLNIIHRDMSPQNVMLSYEGSVKIVDFGIAKAKDRVDETRSGVIKGKFGYMSPEQANGEPVDHRTDIFSTCIILYELLTSKRLFSAENDMATLKMIQECIIPPPSKSNPKVTAELEKIVMKGLTKDLALRYQSAGDLHRDLQGYLNKHFGSFTQKELADAMLRVFKEEISTEKKRFEQIYRQSIPFSQGAKLDDNEDGDQDENNSAEFSSASRSEEPADKDDLTRSEAVEKTGETNFGNDSDAMPSEIPFDVGNDGISKGISRTNPTNQTDPKFQNSVTNRPTQLNNTADETVPATRAQKIAAQEQNEKTIVESSVSMFTDAGGEASSVGVPTEGNTSSQATSPKKEDRFGQSKLPSSGVKLETRAGDAEEVRSRRERSISQLNEVSGQESAALPSYTESQRVSVSQPITPQPRRPAKREQQEEEEEEEDYLPMDEESSISATTMIRTLITAILLVVILIGTFKVWRIYLAGGLPTVMTGVIKKYSNNDIKKSKPLRKPEDPVETVPGTEPARKIANNECSIAIDSDPRGVGIKVNGQAKGETPVTLLLGCNRDFNVSFQRDGFEPVTENVLMNNSNKKLYKTLKAIPIGNLELTVNPGVSITIDGGTTSQYVGAGEAVSFPLRANTKHRVHFKNEVLGIDATRDYKVTAGAVTKEIVRLNPGESPH